MKLTRSRLENIAFRSLALAAFGAVATAQNTKGFDIKTPPIAFAKSFEALAPPASSSAAAVHSKFDGAGIALVSGRPDRSRMHYSDAGGDVWARGATYKAHFGSGGLELIPLFGAAAPQNYPLELELATVTIAGDALAFDATAKPEQDIDRIVYDRGSLDEIYDLAPRAVEQSFVFSDLPVRGALSLRIEHRGEYTLFAQGNGVRFAHELGAVECSGAVVYDSNGNSIALDVTIAGNSLAIDVPASFVANAVLPLTVDPILTTISIDATSTDNSKPDIAYDMYCNAWRTVYEERISQTDIDIYTASFNSNGVAVAGGSFYVDLTSERWAHPRIANVHLNSLFAIVAEAGAVGARQIKGLWISAVTQAHGVPYVIADNLNGEKINPDIGGDSINTGASYFCVVYERVYSATDHDIHARLLNTGGYPASPFPILVDNSSNSIDSNPAIAESNGTAPNATRDWTIAWERQATVNDRDIYGARVHWDGTLTDTTFGISASYVDETHPTVSSPLDVGTSPYPVLVAFERHSTATNKDIQLVEMAGHNYVTSVNLSQLEGLAHLDQRTPSIACDGHQFAIAFAEQWTIGASDYDVWVSHVAVAGGVIGNAAAREHVGWWGFVDSNPALYAQHSGGGASPNFCAVWDVDVGGSTGHDILGAIVNGPLGGTIESYCGGGTVICPCNNAGVSGHGCANSVNAQGALLAAQGVASVSNDSLVFTSNSMPPTASCLFFEGTSTAGAPFGDGIKCVGGTIQRLGLKIATGGTASYPAAGDASISVKGLVPLIGGTRYYQAWYRDPASYCTNKTFNMSNALKITWLP